MSYHLAGKALMLMSVNANVVNLLKPCSGIRLTSAVLKPQSRAVDLKSLLQNKLMYLRVTCQEFSLHLYWALSKKTCKS